MTANSIGRSRSLPTAALVSSFIILFLGNVVAGAVYRRPRKPSTGAGRAAFSRDPASAEASGDADAERADTIARKRRSPVQEQRASERGRGREADSPGSIPARGWKDILWRVYKGINDHRVVTVAAGVTFYALLAIFPAIGALVSLYGLFADATTISDHLASLSQLLPGGAIDVIGDQIKRVASQGTDTLGMAFFFGLAVSLWSANAGIKALFDASNIVYDEVEKRNLLLLNAISLMFTLGAILFAMAAMGVIVILPFILQYVWLGDAAELLLNMLRWPALLITTMFGLSLLYRFGPSRTRARWRWVSWSSALAAVLWVIVSMAFSWYAANFGSYEKTYGSLGAAIVFMTWIWLSSVIILLGAELNAEMEHQTARDTTTGPEKPLGARGATMADTVGAAQS